MMEAERLSVADLVLSLQQGLKQCNELHDKKCQVTPMADRSPEQIPDWVIDTQEYCIVPGDSVPHYVTLSYVWSSPSDIRGNHAPAKRLMLRRKDLDHFKQREFLSPTSEVAGQLPRVIRDAMDFVRQSDMRYLWVDCLCIIQDDENIQDRVEKMKEIYSGALFTIIAATTSSGLYGPESSIDRASIETDSPDALHLHEALLTSYWATRGWTFQEQLLSKRAFVFLDDWVFWDCQSAIWWSKSLITTPAGGDVSASEDITIWSKDRKFCFQVNKRYREDRIAKANNNANRQLSQALTSLSMPDFRLYRELICRYNYRDLTHAQDALPAISGVLDALARGFSGGFIGGLPAVFLDAALLWQPFLKGKRRICSDEKAGPSSLLPSWSWVGWQAKIDPVSLESGLDYEAHAQHDYHPKILGRRTRGYVRPYSQTTRTLVDWSVLASADADSYTILAPELLERCKSFLDDPEGQDLPHGWCRKTGKEAYTEISIDGRMAPKEKSSNCYFHELDPTSVFRYPLPITADAGRVIKSQEYMPFLSCTTTMIEFKIRRVLIPHKKEPVLNIMTGAPLDFSIFDTPLYTGDPDLNMCCPVITLEDGQGRWAGVLRVMDGDTSLENQQTVEVIAISQGSSTYIEAALTYEERVDRLACYQFGNVNSDHYHFALSGDIQLEQEEGKNEDIPSGDESLKDNSLQDDSLEGVLSDMKIVSEWFEGDLYENMETKSDYYKSMEQEAAGLDQGPFFRRGVDCMRHDDGLLTEWEYKTYDFYNVLWVQRKGDYMERKAVGRVPKDVWEQNPGVLQKIVLG